MTNPALSAAHRVLTAIDTGDLRVLDDLVTADFVDHGSPVPVPPGPEGYRQVLGFVSHVLRVSYELQDEIVTSDRIVLRTVAHGFGVAAVHGPAAAGKPYTMAATHIYRTEGDRLAEHWGVRDELAVLIQLGVLPSPRIDLAEAAPAEAGRG